MDSQIVHFEIPAKSPEKLSKFYSKCFGWKFKDSGMTEMKYWLISTSSKKNSMGGGMYKKSEARQKPTNYVMTSNIDTALKNVKKAGGKILVGKQPIPNMGWSAIASDPEGNMLGLFQPGKMRK